MTWDSYSATSVEPEYLRVVFKVVEPLKLRVLAIPLLNEQGKRSLLSRTIS